MSYIFVLLAVIGFYQILRGLFKIIEDDAAKNNLTSKGTMLYFVITVICCIVLFLVPARRESEESYQRGYETGVLDARMVYSDNSSEGYDDGYDDGYSDGFIEGNNDVDIEYIVQLILDEANSFASEGGKISVWEAMDLISIYLDGYDPDGYPLPTKAEFEEAVEVLQSYAAFLEWNSKSFKEIARDADPFA